MKNILSLLKVNDSLGDVVGCINCFIALTFYSLPTDFLDGKRADKNVRMRSLSSKCMEAVSTYFNRVGDKRPNKDGIYLPS